MLFSCVGSTTQVQIKTKRADKRSSPGTEQCSKQHILESMVFHSISVNGLIRKRKGKLVPGTWKSSSSLQVEEAHVRGSKTRG